MHCSLDGFINPSVENPSKGREQVSVLFKLLLLTFDFVNFSDLIIILILYVIIKFLPLLGKNSSPDTPKYKWKKYR